MASGREQQTLKKEEKQQVVISTGGIFLSWSHRCAEADLIWVMSRAENVPSPPCPRQAGNPADSYQGRPFARARPLPESRGKLFSFHAQSFSFTEDTQYRSNRTMARHTCGGVPHTCPATHWTRSPDTPGKRNSPPFQTYQYSKLQLP